MNLKQDEIQDFLLAVVINLLAALTFGYICFSRSQFLYYGKNCA